MKKGYDNMYVRKIGDIVGPHKISLCSADSEPYRVTKTGRVLTMAEEGYVSKNTDLTSIRQDDCTLMQQLSDYCDRYFKKCGIILFTPFGNVALNLYMRLKRLI